MVITVVEFGWLKLRTFSNFSNSLSVFSERISRIFFIKSAVRIKKLTERERWIRCSIRLYTNGWSIIYRYLSFGMTRMFKINSNGFTSLFSFGNIRDFSVSHLRFLVSEDIKTVLPRIKRVSKPASSRKIQSRNI